MATKMTKESLLKKGIKATTGEVAATKETVTEESATTNETTTTTIVEESQRYTDEGVSNDTVND